MLYSALAPRETARVSKSNQNPLPILSNRQSHPPPTILPHGDHRHKLPTSPAVTASRESCAKTRTSPSEAHIFPSECEVCLSRLWLSILLPNADTLCPPKPRSLVTGTFSCPGSGVVCLRVLLMLEHKPFFHQGSEQQTVKPYLPFPTCGHHLSI